MEIVNGKIVDFDGRGMNIFIPAAQINIERACLRQYSEAVVGLPDGRTISPEQRRKAYALLGEIAEWAGEAPEHLKKLMKIEFIAKMQSDLAKKIFSLSDCDVTTAREFISYLIDFIIYHGVPTRTPLRDLCEDIEKYICTCLMHKKCAVCGAKAELHHFDAIGMGRDRTQVYQIGMKVIPLCGAHHSETHIKGRSWLINDMHLVGVPLTAEIGKVYKLTKKNFSA